MHVFLIAAITVDGYIAAEADQISTAWTSAEDKTFFRDRTKQAGVIVMGRKTYDTIGRPLPGRLNVVLTSSPQDVSPDQADQLMYTSADPKTLIADLAARGYQEVAICGGASVYSQFLEAGVIDTLYLTVEPICFGRGIKLFSDISATKLTLKQTTPLSEQTLLLEYAVKRTQA